MIETINEHKWLQEWVDDAVNEGSSDLGVGKFSGDEVELIMALYSIEKVEIAKKHVENLEHHMESRGVSKNALRIIKKTPTDIQISVDDSLKSHEEKEIEDLKGQIEELRGRSGIDWVDVEDRKPTCYITGDWDGKKSDQVLCEDEKGKKYLATCYEGTTDGSHFFNWYDQDGFETEEIVKWKEIQ